jgi:hypothetical protein
MHRVYSSSLKTSISDRSRLKSFLSFQILFFLILHADNFYFSSFTARKFFAFQILSRLILFSARSLLESFCRFKFCRVLFYFLLVQGSKVFWRFKFCRVLFYFLLVQGSKVFWRFKFFFFLFFMPKDFFFWMYAA